MEQRSPRFKQIASTGILLFAAFIWGMCFVAQRSGMEHGIRATMASGVMALILLGALLIQRAQGHTNARFKSDPAGGVKGVKQILIAGLLCGSVLFLASNMQQIGMVTVTASKAAFITTLYIVLVPVLGLFLRHKTHWNTWLSVAIAVVGLYLLCAGDGFSLEAGDSILIASALFWAFHIFAVGHYAPKLSVMQLFGLCAVQFGVAGVLSLVCTPLFDSLFVSSPVTLEAIMIVAPELLYAGILSTAGGFTLAAIGQRYAKPTPAAIVMSTESVFGLLGGLLYWERR